MKREAFIDELEEAVAARTPLRLIAGLLRRFRDAGITRDEVQVALEAMRERVTDEATEDRILEVLDVVSGFCSPELDVWDGADPAEPRHPAGD
jgi:hypothetical protein